MKVLAIDTSTGATVVAAASGERVVERRHDPAPRERPQHTASSLVLAEQALRELGVGWRELERVGVGIGPGSFTGLRAGLSAAAGVARAAGIGLVPVRATAVIEHAARAAHPGAASVLAVVDGRRGELFIERFATAGEGGGVERISRAQAGELSGLADWIAAGDGALLEREALLAAGAVVPEDPSLHRLSGVALAALTAAGAPQHPDAVRPAYGREPDAVPTAQREATR